VGGSTGINVAAAALQQGQVILIVSFVIAVPVTSRGFQSGMAGNEGTLARLENVVSYPGLEFSCSPIKPSQVLATKSHVIPNVS